MKLANVNWCETASTNPKSAYTSFLQTAWKQTLLAKRSPSRAVLF